MFNHHQSKNNNNDNYVMIQQQKIQATIDINNYVNRLISIFRAFLQQQKNSTNPIFNEKE